jgi:hypothetical protein
MSPIEHNSSNNMEVSQKMTRTRWRIEQIINIDDYDFECATFNTFGTRIIVGGEKLIMYEFNSESCTWNHLWETKNPTPVRLILY